jgi:hypothetical protein
MTKTINIDQLDVEKFEFSSEPPKQFAGCPSPLSIVTYDKSTDILCRLAYIDKPLECTLGFGSGKMNGEDLINRKFSVELDGHTVLYNKIAALYDATIEASVANGLTWEPQDDEEDGQKPEWNTSVVKKKFHKLIKDTRKDEKTKKNISKKPTLGIRVKMGHTKFSKLVTKEDGTQKIERMTDEEVVEKYFFYQKTNPEDKIKRKPFFCVPGVKFPYVVIGLKWSLSVKADTVLIIDQGDKAEEDEEYTTSTGVVISSKTEPEPVKPESIINENGKRGRDSETTEEPEAKVPKNEEGNDENNDESSEKTPKQEPESNEEADDNMSEPTVGAMEIPPLSDDE